MRLDYPNYVHGLSLSLSCLGFFLFNVSHWMFAFQYFSITRKMPFKLVNLKVPRPIVICDHINNGIFLTLNCIAPTLTAALCLTGIILLNHITNINSHYLKVCFKLGIISYMITLSLPLITGLYLFVALYFIRK